MTRKRRALAARKQRCGRVTYRPALELLEQRQLLAADLGCGLPDTSMSATDTAAAESISVDVDRPAHEGLFLVSSERAEGEAGATTPQPVLILPGILGSLPRENLADWLTFDEAAMSPENLQVDPVKLSYDDLLASLVAAGYNDGTQAGLQTLWAAPYDWRLPVAPRDGSVDGTIDVTKIDATDSVWEYGIEYVHYWVEQAREAWSDGGMDPALFSVDIVAHSMGGLLARSYLQSDFYQDGDVDQLIMLGTPNHGAVDAYQVREWINDTLTLAPDIALERVQEAMIRAGSEVELTGSLLAAGVHLLNSPDVESYSPSITDLLPTFDFISHVWPHVNVQGIDDNVLLLDLNAQFDYASQEIDVLSLVGTGIETNYELYQPLGLELLNIVAFDNLPNGDGDGTVLTSSAMLDGVASKSLGEIEHVELAGADVAAQAAIFGFLGITPPTSGFSSGAYRSILAGVGDWFRAANSSAWHNSAAPADVNADGFVSPVDALHVIASLNQDGSRELPLDRIRSIVAPYFDVNFDGVLSPVDALLVIHRLNHGDDGAAEGEGSAASPLSLPLPAGNSTGPLEQTSDVVDSVLTSFSLARPIAGVRQALPTGLPNTQQLLSKVESLLDELSEELESILDSILL